MVDQTTQEHPGASGGNEAVSYPGYSGEPTRPGFLKRWLGGRSSEGASITTSTLKSAPGKDDPATTGGSLESTFGIHKRQQVPDTSLPPWSAICHLAVDVGGKISYGTGFLVAPNVVLTAAHVLHPRGHRRGVSVRVMPGRNSTAEPVLYEDTTNFFLPASWNPSADDPTSDFGIIMVDPARFAACGTLKLQVLNDADLRLLKKTKSLLCTVAGYPSDKPRGTLWRSRGPLLDFDASAAYYLNDTKAGQSGGPVFGYNAADQPVVFAIHVQGDQESNVARRIHGIAAREIAARLGTSALA